jgi:hypothetical protein
MFKEIWAFSQILTSTFFVPKFVIWAKAKTFLLTYPLAKASGN